VKLDSSDFELFGVSQQFAQDKALIDTQWKRLQKEAHPDKFASQGAAAQRVAMQWSVRINEAYQRLKNPLKRAAYLCELGGAPVNAHTNTAMSPTFLVQQMEWREALDDAKTVQDLESLRVEVDAVKRHLLAACETALDVQHDCLAAVQPVRELMFIDKFTHDLDQGFDRFE
jgi:molecular chaperone HscB